MNELLQNLVLVFLVAGGVLHVFQRLRLPLIVGLLVAGVVIGPHGLGVLQDRADVETLADIGILLLMFSIGLEFTQDRLGELVRAVGLGAAQIVIAISLTAIVTLPFVDRGEPVYFGDCSRIDVLRKMSLATARGLVLAVSDARATRQAVQAARRENPGLKIVARTRYLSEIDALQQAGADEVVSEEFETSLEVLALTLRLFDVPRSAIDRILDRLRGDRYHLFRAPASTNSPLPMLASMLPGVVFETHAIPANASACGRTLTEIDLRARTGATVLAICRQNDQEVAMPAADLRLRAGDDVLLAGSPSQVKSAIALLESTAVDSSAAAK